jgi:hypothetical protein
MSVHLSPASSLPGMKSRGVYETPGGTILLTARRAMESITLDRGEAHLKVGRGGGRAAGSAMQLRSLPVASAKCICCASTPRAVGHVFAEPTAGTERLAS